jgi:hypothetical protein
MAGCYARLPVFDTTNRALGTAPVLSASRRWGRFVCLAKFTLSLPRLDQLVLLRQGLRLLLGRGAVNHLGAHSAARHVVPVEMSRWAPVGEAHFVTAAVGQPRALRHITMLAPPLDRPQHTFARTSRSRHRRRRHPPMEVFQLRHAGLTDPTRASGRTKYIRHQRSAPLPIAPPCREDQV